MGFLWHIRVNSNKYITMKKIVLSIACLFGSLFSNAQIGASLDFDGGDDYIDIGTAITQTNSYTKEAWIYADASGSNNIISSASSPFWLAGGSLSVAHGWGSGFILSDPSSFPLNVWTHVAVTFDDPTNTLILYKNGAVVATSTSAPAYVAEDIQIGAYQASNFFQGMIDEVRIWDVVRTQCEINSYMNCEIPSSSTGLVANYHFNQGIDGGINSAITTLSDDSGNSNTGTLNNFSLSGTSSNWIAPGAVTSGYSTPSVCPAASALNFDGVNDYVMTGSNITHGNHFTYEAWIKPMSANQWGGIMTTSSASGESQWVQITLNGAGALRAEIVDDSGNNKWYEGNTSLLGAWHHIAVSFDGTNLLFYVDGNLETTSAINNNPLGTISINAQLNIGAERNHNVFYSGDIDEVRVWNTVRSQCDIISYKNCEIPTASAGLVANYHFNQGFDMMSNPSITTLTDASGNANDGTLSNFDLTGAASNWVAPGGVVSGFTTSIACPVAAALDLDGNDDFVLMPDATINDLQSGTIETWVYLKSNTEEVICAKQHNFVGSYAILAVGTDGSPITPGKIFFSARNGSFIYSNLNLSTGQWYHIAATFNGSGANLYVNGVLDATTSGNFTVPNDLSTDGTAIGAWLGDGGGKYLDGQMDEFRVWDVARTQCEINTYMNCEIPSSTSNLMANYHFNQGLASYSNPTERMLTDASGDGYDGTLNNFGLTGTTSNWVAPGGVVSGYTTTLAPPVISVNSGAICAGQSFTMVPSGAATYTYSSGTDIVTPTSDATYSVSGTATTGCTSSQDAVASVTVNALPMISVNSGTICSGSSFTMVPTGATTYTYSSGTDVVSPTSDASYSVSGTDANGCVSLIDAISSVTVNALPTISVNSGAICSGSSFTMVPTGATTYTYSSGTDVVSPTGDASYSVSGTDANGCVSLIDAISSVTVNALPTVMAMTSNTLLCSGETATLSVMGNATTYTWSTTETSMDIVVAPTSPTTYTVDGTDANGCVNSTTILQDVSLCTGIVTLGGHTTSINVYPNPNNGLFIIDLNTTSQVSITDALGQVVFNETLSIGKQNLDIQNHASGIYFVKVIQQDKQDIIKLIKK
jgi:hypothetical protein